MSSVMAPASNFPQTLGDPNATPYDQMIMEVRRRMMQDPKPTYTPEQIADRRSQNENEYQLGMLGMLSGNEGLQNAGGQVFKQALGMRTPKIGEHGMADPLTGQFSYSPEYQQQRYEGQLQGLEARQAAVLEARRAEKANADLRRELQTDRLANKTNAPGTFNAYGTGPAGENIVENTKTGLRYKVEAGPTGEPVYTPWSGAATPKGTFEKNVEAASTSLAAGQRARQLLDVVKQDPDAFGLGSAIVSTAPTWAQGYVAPLAGLTPEQLQKRAGLLRQAAMETHELYGAAQSAGELARAATFMPLPTDTPEVTMSKLAAAADWAEETARRTGPAAVSAAKGRTAGALDTPTAGPRTPPITPRGNGPGAVQLPQIAPPTSTTWTPEKQQRLDELKRRHLQGG